MLIFSKIILHIIFTPDPPLFKKNIFSAIRGQEFDEVTLFIATGPSSESCLENRDIFLHCYITSSVAQ